VPFVILLLFLAKGKEHLRVLLLQTEVSIAVHEDNEL